MKPICWFDFLSEFCFTLWHTITLLTTSYVKMTWFEVNSICIFPTGLRQSVSLLSSDLRYFTISHFDPLELHTGLSRASFRNNLPESVARHRRWNFLDFGPSLALSWCAPEQQRQSFAHKTSDHTGKKKNSNFHLKLHFIFLQFQILKRIQTMWKPWMNTWNS